MGSKNSGSLFNPKNLVPAVLTGGLSYGLSSMRRAMQPPSMPGTPPPPDPGAQPTTIDGNQQETVAERQKRIKAMQYGFASTITNKPAGGLAAPLAAPVATALKTKTGQ